MGNLVPGIDVTNDPLLQARLFSYVDTQLTRLGGPNFNQIPINRPQAPVNDMLRDGFHQHAVHSGVAPYRPNSLDGGCPFHAAGADRRVRGGARRGAGEPEGARPGALVRRPLLSGPPLLPLDDPGGAGAHQVLLHVRAGQVLRAGDPRDGSSSAWRTSTHHLCAAVATFSRATCSGAHDRAGRRRAEPSPVAGGHTPTRPTVARSGSSSTPPATQGPSPRSSRVSRRALSCLSSSPHTVAR